ncbi:MAG: DUF2182 domain-containing protein [Xanthomonadales bacterium]|nr:DUF2182 domain-containing protein [Xanthomonadales bacterium]NIN59326.1 DUF2182 domain-containing protein [Xanthomonadales bacterium]NIN74630.1 DUF2182 domain-containing protein [Xanthomonadales bacterium]NIO12580.1 DUF2182 domain-containing protein [Xanthomonadales bacterium]NIP11719.1 DUF2182 domain-containing protein [Xanthomonadales bacterium]
MGALVTLAWLTLWAWERSPYGRYLDHGSWTEFGAAGSAGHVHWHGPVLLTALLYIGGWVLMTAAMMLPTTLPLIDVFRRLTRKRVDTGRLVSLVIVGYLAAWLGFGVVAHLLDWGVNAAVRQSPWLGMNGWVMGALVLGVAGAFQFSALKYRCLEQCRSPLSFVLRHWRGGDAQRQALTIGVAHGIYCVGCCWALMLLMFVVGTGSVGWMFLLGAVMAAEKNLPRGRVLAGPLGFALLAGAALVLLQNRVLWPL